VEVDLRKKYIPTEKQYQAHIAPERYTFYGGAMRGGKTVWMCNEGIQLSIDYPGNRGFLCRWELGTFKKTTLLTLEEYLDPDLIKRHNLQDHEIELTNGSIIFYGGLKPSSDAVGAQRLKSFELGWFGIDEATEVPKKYFDMLKSRLTLKINGTEPHYRGLLASNPEEGWVCDTFIDRNLEDHAFIPALPSDNPFLRTGYEAEMTRDLPPELVRAWMQGEWHVQAGENYLFPYSLVRAAVQREGSYGEPVQGAMDVAREGGDEIVFGVRYGPVFRFNYIKRYQAGTRTVGETAQIIDEIERNLTLSARKFTQLPVYIDMPGMGGSGFYDPLKEQGYDVRGFEPGGAAHNPERFVNAKAEAAWNLRLLLEDGYPCLPDDPELVSQLVSMKYQIRSDKKIICEEKAALKKRLGKSPDRADTVIMAYYDIPAEAEPNIWIG